MKIAGTIATTVEINEREQNSIARTVIKRISGLSDSREYFHYIHDDKLMLCVEHSAGSHSFDERTIVRSATALDRAACTLLKELE